MPAPAPPVDDLRALIAPFLQLEGPMLPILHALQAKYGCIPTGADAEIATALNITKAEVHGVVSFYHDFRDTPAGRHTLKICRAEACKAVGGDALATATLAKLGLDWRGTTANGAVTVEPVYCLGLCACGPAVIVDNKVVGRVTPARMDAILQQVGA
ncbi:formate dehydrogenase gamma subunit [Pseudorhodobacter antarcticus]|uniref:Formate dehydrogenase gamma subunit n=1 Tax=Pseudorhodobacter antarcticus TaxID=1077947 RepID=A0A1H8GWZ3_9RHOB|nr:formate dehydrogenase subunit gamma [Pseudorhodobacter antarcticus]SEN48513.1 formate dehydrogenase gamma subunit [Pseudorhodobacter antarcticus]